MTARTASTLLAVSLCHAIPRHVLPTKLSRAGSWEEVCTWWPQFGG